MASVIAFANQKGGVAKTTTVHALGDAFTDRGHSVLVVDLDPQACLTYAMGIDAENLDATLHDVFTGRGKVGDIVISGEDGPDLLPSSIDLAGAEVHLLTKTGREFVLARALRQLAGSYELILIDCGPSLGILTINGLTAAEWVTIPFQCDTLSHRGVGQLLDTVTDVRSFTNETLGVLGGVATLFDGRTRLANEVLATVADRHELRVFSPPIPKSVRAAEAPGRGRSVLRHAPSSKPAIAYRELAESIERAL
ncbi:MAG: ParA family protein [Acidimicrobiia bacterium]|nr:ParA family protein [Acidimicrobiia bacterium]